MRYSHTGDKQHRFSFRKLSVGLVSAAVASVFLGYSDYSVQPVLATTQTAKEQLSTVGIYHTTENELTEAERERVIKALPVQLEAGDQAYYYVYRPTSVYLPKTGELNGFASLAGVGFLVLVATYHRKRRQWLLSVALLTTAGTLLLSTDAEALTSHILAHFNQNIELSVGDKLPHPTKIDGYDYVGYLKITNADKVLENTVGNDLIQADPIHEGRKTEGREVVGSSVTKEEQVEAVYTETVSKLDIAFDSQEIETPELFEGERELIQSGVVGERTIVTGKFISMGQLISEQVVSDTVTRDPKPEIIRIGTKKRQSEVTQSYPVSAGLPEVVRNETVEKQIVPYDIQEVASADLYEGERTIGQMGIAGERTIVTELFTSDGKLVSEKVISDSITIAPQPEIIYVGTKPRVAEVPTNSPVTSASPEVLQTEVVETLSVDFEVQEVASSELYEGERKVGQLGVPGERTIVTERFISEDEVVSERVVSDSITRAPQPEIIYVGTKKKVTSVPMETLVIDDKPAATISVDKQEMPFDTRYEADETMPLGEKTVSVSGINGERQLTTVGGQVIQEEVIREVRTEIVTVGTAPTKTVTDLPFEIEYVEDSTKYIDTEEEVVKEGVNGQRILTTTYSVDTVTGTVTPNQPIEDIVEPVKKVVKIGTKVRELPILEIDRIDKNEDERSALAHFTLRDDSKVALSAKAQLYKGNVLVKEFPIQNKSESLLMTDLEYYTDYTLKTVLTYDIGQGEISELQTDIEEFRLEYKKIEIKDIDNIHLYRKDNDRYVRLFSLTEKPSNLDDYFVKIDSDRFKDVLLPIKSIDESESGNYSVKAHIPELVQGKTDVYQPDFTFEVAKAKQGPMLYSSFKALVEAIKGNPTGNFQLSSNISATDVADDGSPSYIPETFSGTLTGLGLDNKPYAIYDLAKPLFKTLSRATVKDLDLKNVSIFTKNNNVAPLAITATDRSRIENLSVEGKITADRFVAGVVANAEKGTTITNTAFTGTLRSLNQDNTDNSVGGIVAVASLSSMLSKVRSDASTYIIANSNNQKAGSLVGILKDSSTLSDSYASGKLVNSGQGGQIGGLVGSTWKAGVVRNVISEVDVINGNKVHGDSGYGRASITDVFVRDNVRGKEDLWSKQTVTSAEAEAKRDALGITTTLSDTTDSMVSNLYSVDYLGVKNAQEGRETIYNNIERLMPFYNKELIVYYGNKLDTSHKLARVALVDVVPMFDNTIVTNLSADKARINRIMLHYSDNTVDYLDVSFKETFANNHVVEYNLADTGLIYTPEELVSDYASLIAKLNPLLSSVNFDSAEIRTALNLPVDDGDNKLSRLYLEESFNAIKADLNTHLIKTLSMNNAINTRGLAVEDYLFQKIAQNKEAFLLGLAYLQRWYDINYDTINTKELSTYKFDFFGNNATSTIDEIIKLGQSGYPYLQANKNEVTYNHLLADVKHKDGLFSYLESYRHLFVPNKSNADWFKDNTKAYMPELLSNIEELKAKQLAAPRDSLYTHRVYNRLTQSNWAYRNMVLPLLTLKDESVYVIPSLSTLSFGGYERYLSDQGAKDGDPKAYVRSLVDQSAEWHRNHFDFWYKLLSPESKEKLPRNVLNYDGFSFPDASGKALWRTLDDESSSIRGFFGPVGRWYGNNGLGAYATGTVTHFVVNNLFGRYGASTFTHEMVHNSDSNIYFEGYGRRTGLGAELFATGLLQSPDYIEQPSLAINHIFNDEADSANRMHTNRPNQRFNNAQDLQHYFKGIFDVMYLLEYAEGQSVLKQTADVKKAWLRKIENYYVQDPKSNQNTHAGNTISQLTDEDIARLTSFDSLIDNNIVTRRGYSDGKKDRNGYYTISISAPNYAALSNEYGAPGDIMFRRMAFELLAAKGYHEGFLPYVSNQFKDIAIAENSLTWSNWERKDIPLVTDKHVFDNVLASEYGSWSDFKKQMYRERIAKKDSIKPVTIQYKLGDKKSTQEVTISSYEQLQQLIDDALAHDIKNLSNATKNAGDSFVELLKRKIYNAYLRDSNDFTDSIFK